MAGGKRAGTDGRTSEQGETGPGRGGQYEAGLREYHFSGTGDSQNICYRAFCSVAALDYLFYQNKWLMLLAIPVDSGVSEDRRRKQLIRERKKESELSVQRCAECIERGGSGGIFCRKCSCQRCSRDLERMYPEEADIVQEFHYMETQFKGQRSGGRTFHEPWRQKWH